MEYLYIILRNILVNPKYMDPQELPEILNSAKSAMQPIMKVS